MAVMLPASRVAAVSPDAEAQSVSGLEALGVEQRVPGLDAAIGELQILNKLAMDSNIDVRPLDLVLLHLAGAIIGKLIAAHDVDARVRLDPLRLEDRVLGAIAGITTDRKDRRGVNMPVSLRPANRLAQIALQPVDEVVAGLCERVERVARVLCPDRSVKVEFLAPPEDAPVLLAPVADRDLPGRATR